MLRIFILHFLFVFLMYLPVYAQINNQLLEQNIELQDSNEQVLSMNFSNQNFFKNNEYFHDITTGYTLFGSLLQLQAAYQPYKNWMLQGGIFLRKDFGNPGFKTIEPIFTIKYQKNGYSVLVGNLEGNVGHRLIEPIFNYERFVTHYNENGLQFKVDKEKIWADTWLNWEVMEYNKSDFQEEFAAGHGSKWTLWSQGPDKVSLCTQGLIGHIGGQVDIDTNAVRSQVNLGLGLAYHRKTEGVILDWEAQLFYTVYKELAPSKIVAISEGQGWLANLLVKSKYHINSSISFWNGINYLAPRGGDLFQSVSSYYVQNPTVEKTRKLIFLRFMYQKPIYKNLHIDIRAEPYADLLNGFVEYSYSFYLTYKHDFRLFNERNRKKN